MIKKFNTKVVGVTFNNIQEYLPKIKINDNLQAIFEPNNPYDKNAVAIYHRNHKIGYISKDIAKYLNSTDDINIIVTAITGGFNNQSYGCNILVTINDHKIEEIISADDIFNL